MGGSHAYIADDAGLQIFNIANPASPSRAGRFNTSGRAYGVSVADNYAYVAAWEYTGDNQPEVLHKEELVFENVKLTQRSYK